MVIKSKSLIMQRIATPILCTMLCLIVNSSLKAQGWKRLPVVVHGKIMSHLKQEQDSILIKLNQDAVIFGDQMQSYPINQKGEFTFTLKPIDHPAKLGIALKGDKYFMFNNLVEPGDTLHIQIDLSSGKSLKSYQGNNYLKYLISDSLEMKMASFSESRSLPVNAETLKIATQNGNYEKIHRYYFTEFNELLKVLDRNKNSISPAMSVYFKAYYTYFYLAMWEVITKIGYSEAKTENVKNNIVKSYQLYTMPDYNFDQNLASYCPYYLEYLILKHKTDLLFKSEGKGFTYSSLYHQLRMNYSGMLRERLLTYMLVDYKSSIDVINYNPSEFDACVDDALKLIKTPFLANLLIDKSKLKEGTAVYNFSMVDTTGKTIRLSDLRGKVVLLDIWAEGCSGCALFHEMISTKVYPSIKNETDFEIVSVSVDKTKERWIRGINSGKYTSREHLNLFTEGLALNHPFTKYYNLSGIPFILLIDKNGKVYSKIDLGLSSQELLKLIGSALASGKSPNNDQIMQK
jgi:cytochrome oxidase Cu insertion factor (SCO1/SenC/PrrC family)